MHDTYIIETIEDLLPFVAMKPEFQVREREGFTFIDYDYVDQHTFDIPALMECRGIKFSPKGLILARPFKKFFNYGERGSGLPIHRRHFITEKMDGSMVHGIFVNHRLYFHTRAGYTDVAKKAQSHVLNTPEIDYQKFTRFQLKGGWTPIFEFTSPNNRIVLRYVTDTLTLIGCRHMISGQLMSYSELRENACYHGIPVVPELGQVTNEAHFIKFTRERMEAEGYVVHFDHGYMVKIKADDYVRQHRALDDMNSKRRVVGLCCEGNLDDVMSLLANEDALELADFNVQFQKMVSEELTRVNRYVMIYMDMLKVHPTIRDARKGFAIHIADLPGHYKSTAFAMIDEKDGRRSLLKHYQRNHKDVKIPWRGQ